MMDQFNKDWPISSLPAQTGTPASPSSKSRLTNRSAHQVFDEMALRDYFNSHGWAIIIVAYLLMPKMPIHSPQALPHQHQYHRRRENGAFYSKRKKRKRGKKCILKNPTFGKKISSE